MLPLHVSSVAKFRAASALSSLGQGKEAGKCKCVVFLLAVGCDKGLSPALWARHGSSETTSLGALVELSCHLSSMTAAC